ncbi:hypothetical protein NM208_g7843 [Fusarium decemcellulare]|uniref:Uncharacterized protein n=2 Tax=Fusarium decemcellulare TaxID=57161 RepID=A0ACC1S7I1_9HYPO|nr:hypothetical protein NM208_g7843 [Fusarium decemcellulare]
MKTLSDEQLEAIAGQYFAPLGLYQHTKSLPFLGTVKCNTKTLTAGQWTEIVVEYTVGGSGLADGAWIKGTFKFYSDWALFQTSDPRQDNYVSVEYISAELHPGQTPATVQSLAVRFDQKGHERPFQKAVIIDIVDGYLNPGDKIIVRLGDRRWGAKGTRVQTFVEEQFLMRWYIDPVGTSRFAPIKPDIAINIQPGKIAKTKSITSRVVRPGVPFPIRIHTEDVWGNATTDVTGLEALLSLKLEDSEEPIWSQLLSLPDEGWTAADATATLSQEGDYILSVIVLNEERAIVSTTTDYVTIDASLPVPRILFADLHVHSDDTVGTNSTTYNFSYAEKIAGLDVVGYTANDFNITKERWNQTLDIIKSVNSTGKFVVFPGTEWCGNSAAGGDHNVVFLDDPDTTPPEFPFDRNGNVARSFEWNEHGPSELTPGAWPLDEVYATYAHSPENHLMIPHVGGRRCNLAWHHPKLERLLEIGSAWGLFEWLLRDAVQRGWKLGVSANSDEHRGRCGGGVPGTAVFGTKGGLTGVLSEKLERNEIAMALRARRTFATTGERLVGLVSTQEGQLQGDDMAAKADTSVKLNYQFYGRDGFSSIEAWDASGRIFHRNLQREASLQKKPETKSKLRIQWGGARLFDRYREAIWHGSIIVSGATASRIEVFGGILDDPESTIKLVSDTQITFDSKTSGDFDGVDIFFHSSDLPEAVSVTGLIGGYVKVGDALKGNPHKQQPEFNLVASREEASNVGGKNIEIKGGVELFVSAELLDDVALPRRAKGQVEVYLPGSQARNQLQSVYFVGREFSGGKVVTSPVFIEAIYLIHLLSVMGRDDSSSSGIFDRFFSGESENSSASSKSSGLNCKGSLSTSTPTSASIGASSQPLDPNSTTTRSTMFGPFEIDFGWPSDRSMASVALSSYSPLALRDMPQPRPSDVPSNLDASIFTFEDAFEDLLAVSHGQELPDITTRYEQRKLLRSMFPSGEPAWFWLRRLNSQGLLEDSGPGQLMKSAANYNWDQLHRELDRRAAAVWRAAMGEQDREEGFGDFSRRERKAEDDDFHGHNPLLEDSEQNRRPRRKPDHFDDLFSSIQSSFSSAQSTWDSFVKSINEAPPLVLCKTTVKMLDEEGNEIGSQTHYTVRPAEKDEQPKGGKYQGQDGEGSGIKAEGRLETKTGWFWK